MYKIPRLADINARSKIFRHKKKLLIIGRCVEIEHPEVLSRFPEEEYGVLNVCLEAEHVNMIGFKLAGILARGNYEEIAVLTVDGSLHCTQLHWMVEETCKILGDRAPRRSHYVIYKGKLYRIGEDTVKTSRYLYKVEKLMSKQ